MGVIALLPGGLTSLFRSVRDSRFGARCAGGGSGDHGREFRGVDKSFGGNVVLEGVDLAVEPGFTGLIGPNGAGKTTCLNVVSGYLRRTRATCGSAGAAWSARRRPRWPGWACPDLPDPAAGPEPVRAGERDGRRWQAPPARHIAELFGLPAARHDERAQRERARDLLATFGLGAHPQRQASGFPIGSQKIIEVARALLNDPVLLLLDEPAAGLGAEDVDTLVDGLNGWTRPTRGRVMIIEHDLELITRLCLRVAVLHFGRIIQAGPPKDVLRDPVVVEAYLGADVAAGD
jgi:branched-chain amino acid transport system ATP-binding protein